MAPRGRPRKVGLGRMDAAIDAMAPFGFSKEVTRRMVKQLLKVYEGDEGWIAIEEASYTLLIDTILADQQQSEEEKGPAEEEARGEDDGQPSFAGPSSAVPNNAEPSDDAELIGGVQDVAVSSATRPADGVLELTCTNPELVSTESPTNGKESICCLPSTEREGSGWRDIVLDKHSGPKPMDNGLENNGGNSGISKALIHLPEQVIPCPQPVDNLPKKKRRHCYGWISSDEEYEIVHLSHAITLAQINKRLGGTERRRNRKSRWDVRPEDP